jgi:hypothetical protein
MALTPLTSATSYCTPAQLVQRKDWRGIADSINDTDQPRVSYNAVVNSPIVAAALLDASGELESACITGNRYLPTDLQAMLTNGGAGAGLLVSLVASLAWWRLYSRRMPVTARPEDVASARTALEMIEKLRLGERVFPFVESAEAGLPDTVNPDDINTNPVLLNRIGVQASRFFGWPAGNSGYWGPGYGGGW